MKVKILSGLIHVGVLICVSISAGIKMMTTDPLAGGKRAAEDMAAAAAATSSGMDWLGEEPAHVTQFAKMARSAEKDTQTWESKSSELLSAKAHMKSLQAVRLLIAAVFWSVLLSTEVLQPGKDAAIKHGDQTRGRPGHKLGPPHPHIWRAVLMSIIRHCELLEEHLIPRESLELIKTYLKDYSANPSKHLFFIRMVRVKPLKEEFFV